MNAAAKERLEKEFRDNPPGDLTDSKVVQAMCKQNDEATREVMEQIDRSRVKSLGRAPTYVYTV